MSSKNDILSAIRRHTGKRYDMPETDAGCHHLRR